MKIIHTTLAVALPLAATLLAVTFGGLPKIPAQTQIQTCTISTSGQCSVTFTLGSGDQVSGSASVKGGSDQDTSLWVTDDSGTNIYDGGKVSSVASFLFSAGAAGAYGLHFSNLVSSLTTKLVTVNYNIAARADC